MYKTVRHGENSLQYTILPQTEEVLSASGAKGRGRDYSPAMHVRRARRKSTAKYLLMASIGLIALVALATIPLFVMNGGIFTRRLRYDAHALCAPHTPPEKEVVKSRKKELKITPEVLSTLQLETTASATRGPSSARPEPTPPWTRPAVRSWRDSATAAPPTPADFLQGVPRIGAPKMSLSANTPRPWDRDVIIRPTLNPTTIRDVFRYYSLTSAPVIPKLEDVLISTQTASTTGAPASSQSSKFKDLKDTLLSADDDEDFKEAIEVDEVFNLRPSSPEGVKLDSDEVTVSKANGETWYLGRWPYINTSYIADGLGFAAGQQSYLMPLMVATLSALLLVLLLVLSVRRRSQPPGRKESADDMPSDNTNLLDNTEDAEE